jgi:hypothetical protein
MLTVGAEFFGNFVVFFGRGADEGNGRGGPAPPALGTPHGRAWAYLQCPACLAQKKCIEYQCEASTIYLGPTPPSVAWAGRLVGREEGVNRCDRPICVSIGKSQNGY